MTLAELREQVCRVNRLLPKTGLVTMHSGNASGYDPREGLIVIKPSGVDYEMLTPEMLVCVDLAGQVVEGQMRPSVDVTHHVYLCKHMPDVRSVIHTHSNFATAFSAVERPIPCCLTAIADQFGAEIPCAPYVDNQGDHIGRAIMKYKNDRSPAILLAHHGVFAWGRSPDAALKAAVMAEDVARTVFLAMQLGPVPPLPIDEVDKWHDRYQNQYGQTTN